MNYHILGTIAVSTVFLAACEAPLETSEDAFDQASYNDYVDARNDATSVEGSIGDILTEAPANDTAQLAGHFVIGTTAVEGAVPGDPDDAVLAPIDELVGEMTMNVDFAADTVSGEFFNAFIDHDREGESQVIELDGSVPFSGDIDMDRTFFDSTNTVTWQIEADSAGTFTDVSTADDATPTTYRIDVDINGNFFDTSTIGTVGGVGDVGDVASQGIIEGNVNITTATDTILYDVTDGSEYFVYELEE